MATTKRIATKEIGGRSRNPTLIASQVELQTMQRVSHAAGIFQSRRCIRDSRANHGLGKAASPQPRRFPIAVAGLPPKHLPSSRKVRSRRTACCEENSR